MDRYDRLILNIIYSNNQMLNHGSRTRLQQVEQAYWKKIEAEKDLSAGSGRIGERITNLYLRGLIENKDGYKLTRKGRQELQYLVGQSA